MSTSFKPNNIAFTKTRYLFFWFILFNIAFATLYGLFRELIPGLPSFEDPLVNHIIYTCSFVSICYYLAQELRQSKLNPQYLWGNLRPRYSWVSLLGLAIAFLLFSIGAALVSFHCLSIIAPEFHESFMDTLSEQESRESVLPIISKCLQVINYVIVAPITEEFVFRGVLLHRLATKWNLPVGIWVSSIIFGLLHPNPIGIAAVGFAWALLYIKTRTLVVPIVAHGINNAFAVMGEFSSDFIENNTTLVDSSSEATDNEWIFGLVCLAIALPFVLRFVWRYFPSKDKSLPYFANQAEVAID
ncbi:MAG: CPBP family intramembrane glutamic endopeptidase [Cyanobacteria bacterium P01_G01_bin.19]